jgi:hypothetical protein
LSVVHDHGGIHKHISPAVAPSVSNLLTLSLSVEIIVAPSVSAGVAHNLPVHSEESVEVLFVPDVVAALSERSAAGVVESVGGVAIVLPCVFGSMSAVSAHTSPHDWSREQSLIAAVVPCRISGVTGIAEFVSVLCVSVVAIGRILLDPPVSVGVSSEGLVNLKSSPVVFVTVSVSQQGSVVVELDVAPAASASVALSEPSNSDESVLTGLELSVVGVLDSEECSGVIRE